MDNFYKTKSLVIRIYENAIQAELSHADDGNANAPPSARSNAPLLRSSCAPLVCAPHRVLNIESHIICDKQPSGSDDGDYHTYYMQKNMVCVCAVWVFANGLAQIQ